MEKRLAWVVLGVILLQLVQPSPAVPAQRAIIDPRIWQDLAEGPSAPVLVRLADVPAFSSQSINNLSAQKSTAGIKLRIRQTEDSQRWLRADLEAQGLAYRSYWIVNLIALNASPELVNRLAARPDVVAIESDRAFRIPLEQPATDSTSILVPNAPEPGLSQVHAPELWARGVLGQGIVVASADTGVAWEHQALKSHYRGWNGSQADHNYNWWDAIHGTGSNPPCGYNAQTPCDDYGHGTHTTGTMLGDDGSGNQVGMAPGATWIACRNMDHGVGKPSTYIECLEFFIAPTDLTGQNADPNKRPDVIDNSYSCPPSEGCNSTSLHDAIQQVRAAGIFMSVSAGNSGPSCSTIVDPPAIEQSVFTAGAIDFAGNMATFSSRGPVIATSTIKPDLVAPGVGVRSSYSSSSSSYVSLSGTSMAAPHVAGAVALLWSAFPTLRRDIVSTEALLRISAVPDPVSQACGNTPAGVVPNNTSGYGILNVLAAYNRWLSQPYIGWRYYIPLFSYYPTWQVFIPAVVQN